MLLVGLKKTPEMFAQALGPDSTRWLVALKKQLVVELGHYWHVLFCWLENWLVAQAWQLPVEKL